jgi:hypothetical protein
MTIIAPDSTASHDKGALRTERSRPRWRLYVCVPKPNDASVEFAPASVGEARDACLEEISKERGAKKTAKKLSAKVPARTVRAVHARDGYRCVYCRATTNLSVDHVRTRFEGGTHDATNLVTACTTCNSLRGACSLDLWAEWRERRGVAKKSHILMRVVLAITTAIEGAKR